MHGYAYMTKQTFNMTFIGRSAAISQYVSVHGQWNNSSQIELFQNSTYDG